MSKFEFDYLFQSGIAVDAALYIFQHKKATRRKIAEHYSHNIGTVSRYLDAMANENILDVTEVGVVIQYHKLTRVTGTKTHQDVYSFKQTPEAREFLRILSIIEKHQKRAANKYKR